jgi:hypothetical protein
VIGINESKVIFYLLLDLDLQVGDTAIGRHIHKESTPNSALKFVIDENAKQFSDWRCHDSSSWVEMKDEREWVLVCGLLLRTQLHSEMSVEFP